MKKVFIYFFLFLFSLLIVFCSGVIDSQDGFQYLAVARNIYYKGKPTAQPYDYDTRQNIHMPVLIGKDGESYGFTGLGFSLALVPAVALTDIVYKIYNVLPPIYFPLENDWLILMLASFTNVFFGAVLGVILFLYFLVLKLPIKQAILLAFISIFATNLWVYAKHMNAHMMFVTLVMATFLLVKLYSITKKRYLMFMAGLAFGALSITYNPTFVLSLVPIAVYYLLLTRPRFKINSLKVILKDALFALIGFIPFLLIFLWFENLRAFTSAGINYASPSFYNAYSERFSYIPIPVIFEGIYGQLFSPGRSIFIYSPLLLIPIFFWFKIKKTLQPELFTFVLLSAIYVIFYATQYSIGAPDQGITGLWHGESSWGPRYLTPLIPFGMLIVGSIYYSLKRVEKLLVFLPLLLIGLYINLLGILMPYQTKYANMEDKFLINGTEYRLFAYTNLLPRYTPIINMSNNLVKLAENFPKTLDHGIYNVRFYDGIDFPFNVGPERWRVIEGKGYISFDNNLVDPVKELTFGLINHPLSEASESAALVNFYLNGTNLSHLSLKATERSSIKIPVESSILKEKNDLVIDVQYNDPSVLPQKKQILGLISMNINNKPVNMETLDFPFLSSLGPPLGFKYQNYGNIIKTPWKSWDIHTQIFERTPDLWWIRPLFYWDFPKKLFLILFLINVSGLLFFAVRFFSTIKRG